MANSTKRTFLVPFQEKEIVWCEYLAEVKATSKEDALKKIKVFCNEKNPHHEYDCEFVQIIEHIESEEDFFTEDYTSNDVEEVDEKVYCTLELTAFDIARYGNEELYNMAENSFSKVGLDLEILEMQMIPIQIEEHFVTYKCIPTDFKRSFTDGDVWHMKDGVRI